MLTLDDVNPCINTSRIFGRVTLLGIGDGNLPIDTMRMPSKITLLGIQHAKLPVDRMWMPRKAALLGITKIKRCSYLCLMFGKISLLGINGVKLAVDWVKNPVDSPKKAVNKPLPCGKMAATRRNIVAPCLGLNRLKTVQGFLWCAAVVVFKYFNKMRHTLIA